MLLVDSRSVLLSYHLLLNHPYTVQVRRKRRNTVRYGYWKVNNVQI
jgi:hypothetical protein